jgi:hypothetical protein
MIKSKLLVLAFVTLALMLVISIGAPKRNQKVKRTDARVLERILEICPPLPDKSAFSIPGYKSVQCFYKENPDGKLKLIEDLNQPVSIPKPVEIQ